jgi:predicted transcriptional regulator
VLGLIAERPATRAPDLAASLGRETAPFKADVRKLKELGLTESLEVGYRLSPRGRAYYGYSEVSRKRSRSR